MEGSSIYQNLRGGSYTQQKLWVKIIRPPPQEFTKVPLIDAGIGIHTINQSRRVTSDEAKGRVA